MISSSWEDHDHKARVGMANDMREGGNGTVPAVFSKWKVMVFMALQNIVYRGFRHWWFCAVY